MVENLSLASVQRCDCSHILRVQFKLEHIDIFFNPIFINGLGDHNDTTLDVPAEHHLRHRFPMLFSNPLAAKDAITVDDLAGLDNICSRQSIEADIPRWCGEKADTLRFTGTTNLTYNGSVFVKEGLGCMLPFNGLVDTGIDSELYFRPLTPKLENRTYVIWKKYQVFTPIAERLLETLKADLLGNMYDGSIINSSILVSHLKNIPDL